MIGAGAVKGQIYTILASVPEAYRADYARMLRDPDNIGLIYALGLRFEEGGRYDEAARLYERVVLIYPHPGALLRLALLAERTGQTGAALAYLDRIPVGALTPDEERAARLLRDEAEDASRQHRVEGSVQAGLRYNTNANAAPYEVDPSVPFTIGDADRDSDFGFYLDLDAVHSFDPLLQSGVTYDSALVLQAEKQFELNEFDTVYLLATTGPSIPFDPGQDRLVLRPYARVDGYMIGGEPYSATPGIGLEFRDTPRPELEVLARIEAGWNFYGEAADVDSPFDGTVRDSDDLDGAEFLGEVGMTWSPVPRLTLAAEPWIGYRDAEVAAYRRVEYGIRAEASALFDVVARLSDRPLLTRLYGSYGWYDYEGSELSGPDREDEVFDIGGSVVLPLGTRYAAVADLRWHETWSNYNAYEWDDLQASLGVEYRF